MPDLTCTEQWPTPAESRHSHFGQEQKTKRASSSYRARPLQDPLVPLPSGSWPSTRPASEPQAGPLAEQPLRSGRHRRRHPRATILSHRAQLWRVGEDGCLSARIPVWSHVDPPNVAPVRVKRPARFAGMKGRVSDHVTRYTPRSGRKCIASPTRNTGKQTKQASKRFDGHSGAIPAPACGRRGVDDSRGERASAVREQGETLELTQRELRAQRPSQDRPSQPAKALPPSAPAPSASPSVTSTSAPLAETAAEACDCLALVAEVRNRQQVIRVRRADYEPFVSWGPAAVRRAIAAALHRSSGVFTNGLLAIEFVVGGRVMPTAALPADWAALGRFAESGGTCRLRIRLPGGMDPATLLGQVRLSDDTVNWEELEAEFTRVQSGAAPPDPITESYQLARALFANVGLGQLAPLEMLPASARARGQVTKARIAALITVVRRARLETLPTVPAWLATSDWVELRLNNVRGEHLLVPGHSSLSYERIQGALLRLLDEKIPALRSSATRWARITRNVLLDVDLNAPVAFGVRMQLPTGPWIAALLQGALILVPDSYCTLMPQEGWCETELDSIDGQLLRAIGNCLQITADRFRALLNTTLRNGFRTDCALTRVSTSRYVGGGKGQKSRTLYFTPDSPEAELVVSMDAMSVLIVRRLGPSITLRLGGTSDVGEEWPVTVTITSPHCPRRTLYAMVSPRSAPLRFWPPGAPPTSLMVLFAPMPRGWMHKFVGPTAAKHTAAEEWLERLWQSHLDASALMLVGRYDKQGDPIGLYVEFPTLELTASCVERAHAKQMPPEMLALLKEADFQALLKHALANPCTAPALGQPQAGGVAALGLP